MYNLLMPLILLGCVITTPSETLTPRRLRRIVAAVTEEWEDE